MVGINHLSADPGSNWLLRYPRGNWTVDVTASLPGVSAGVTQADTI